MSSSVFARYSNCSISWDAKILILILASLVLTAGYTIPLAKIPLFCNISAILYTFSLSQFQILIYKVVFSDQSAIDELK